MSNSSDPRVPLLQTILAGLLVVLGLLLVLLWSLSLWQAVMPPQAVPTPTPVARATPTAMRTRLPTLRRTAVPVTPPRSTRQPTRTPRSVTTRVPVSPSDTSAARCLETPGQVDSGQFMSKISSAEERYLIYLPPCYAVTNKRYPVIYLFHGSENDDTQWERLGVFEAMDEGIHTGRLPPAIIVLPDGNYDLFMYTSGGADSYEAQIVDEYIPHIDQNYRTDAHPEARAIGGISRGGVWSLEIGFRHPDLFGLVAGHSPCLNLNESPPEFDPLNMAGEPQIKEQRIWLDGGDMDYCLEGADTLHQLLDQSGVPHVFQVWPGGHEDALWAAHLGEYLAFYTRTWSK